MNAQLDPQTPVLVGIGVVSRRCDDPRSAAEPFALMVEALEAAAVDAGSRALLADADSIRVPRGFWDYSDPGRLVADRLGAKSAHTGLAEIGVLQQTILTEACRAIAAGEEQVALVTGADARYRTRRAERLGVALRDTPQTGEEPDRVWKPAGSLWADLEAQRGLVMPAHYYTIMESALRAARGQTIDAHRDTVASLWARMSEIAARNPHAWHRTPVCATSIREATAENPMIAFPYTKLHNSDWNVDQAAGLLLCSVAKARARGVPEDRWVFPLAGTESNHMLPLATRADLHRCPGIAVAGGRALELAERRVEEVAHLDLYSCFPAAVQIAALELGIPPERPLTVTGGMRFAGGPLNNYVLQATARMAEILRADPGAAGLVTSISGFLNKQGFGVWSTQPPRDGFRHADCSDAVAEATATRELVSDASGPARVAGYTVLFLGARAAKAIAVCDLPDGARTVCNTEDPALIDAMMREEFVGRTVRVTEAGDLFATV